MKAPLLMRALSSEVNLHILSILKSGAFNPRELARILQKDETDISRRLKMLERAGLVEGKWMRIGKKNVKVYSLKVDEIKISFKPTEVIIKTITDESYQIPMFDRKVPNVNVFFGRRAEIEEITSTTARVIFIYGIAGIGKTTLIAKIFNNAFWYQMSELDSFDYLTWQFGLYLNTLGYSLLLDYLRSGGKNERDISELILDGMETTKAEIVIDDIHKCPDNRIIQLFTYLAPRLQKARLVIISREKINLGLKNVMYFHLKGLSAEDAYQLLRYRGIKIRPEKFAEVYHITYGHPLMLLLFAETYKEGEIRIHNFLDFLFNEIYQKLKEDEKVMLQILSIFDEPLEYEEIKTLYKKKNVFTVLYSLVNKGIVEKRGEAYALHDLLKGFAKELVSIDEKEYYMKYINYLLGRKTAKAFIKAFQYAVKLRDEKKVKELIEIRLRKFKRVIQDFPDSYMQILDQIKDNPYVKGELGNIYFQKGLFNKALSLWLEVKDRVEGIHKADVLSSLVDVYIELNEFEKAEKYLKELKKLLTKTQDLEIQLWYYIQLTKFEYYKNNHKNALESAFKELEIVRKLGPYPELESLVLLHVGDIYIGMGMVREGIQYYSQALETAKAYNLTFSEHVSYMELTKAYFILKDYARAIEYGKKAVQYFIKIRNYRRAIDTLAYRCLSYVGLLKLEEAERDAKEMIKIAQTTNYPLAWAGYIFLGIIKESKGEKGDEYLNLGREKLREYPWLYESVMEEVSRVRRDYFDK